MLFLQMLMKGVDVWYGKYPRDLLILGTHGLIAGTSAERNLGKACTLAHNAPGAYYRRRAHTGSERYGYEPSIRPSWHICHLRITC